MSDPNTFLLLIPHTLTNVQMEMEKQQYESSVCRANTPGWIATVFKKARESGFFTSHLIQWLRVERDESRLLDYSQGV